MRWEVKDISGKAVRSIELPESIFNIPMNENVLHAVAKAYAANKRQGTHATKTKAMVAGGGKKPFKQKGTGSARQGSSRSPLMPGGGVTFGPQPRSYREKINTKLKSLALRVALSDKARHNALVVVDDFSVSKYSTKDIVKTMGALKVAKAVLADERKDDFLYKSARNIHGATAVSAAEMNAEHLLKFDSLVISETALEALKKRLGE